MTMKSKKFLILIYRFGSLLLQLFSFILNLKTSVKMNKLVKKINN